MTIHGTTGGLFFDTRRPSTTGPDFIAPLPAPLPAPQTYPYPGHLRPSWTPLTPVVSPTLAPRDPNLYGSVTQFLNRLDPLTASDFNQIVPPPVPLAGWRLEMVSSCVRPAPLVPMEGDEPGEGASEGYLVSADITFIADDPACDEEYLHLTLREKRVRDLDAAQAAIRQLTALAGA